MQWFGLAGIGGSESKKHEQVEGLAESAGFLYELVCEEMERADLENVVLGGN